MRKLYISCLLSLAWGGLILVSPTDIEAKKKSKKTSAKAVKSEAKAASNDKSGASSFQLKALEVVEPNFFTKNVESENSESSDEAQVNPTFRELPHYKDNEFEAKRKKDSVSKKWLGRQFLVVMTPNEYKNSREIIKALEPDIYTNAEMLEAYDFKKKIFPLNVWLGCIDIGTDRHESAAYEAFGEKKFAYTYVTHQICLKNLLALDMAFEKDRYPDYFIALPEKEGESLKASFKDVQIGIVVAWLPDDTGEVKGETVDWGQFEYNGQLGSETFDRLELKWTALEVLIRYKDKIYSSKRAPHRKPRFAITGQDADSTRQKFRDATDVAAKKSAETAEE
ncbi:MAG: hypothetical protein JSR44_05575 [Spirochaetes bacterium]|nr:hypothetical protein [Spirochaetota bacterium]